MIEILALATIIAPLTTAFVEVIKKATGINERYYPLLAVLFGIILGGGAYFLVDDLGLRMWAGGVSGLASVGLFELGKNTTKGDE
ncbi:MAG TPA: holin [Candidatus Nitrosocosmicus sp.]|nr:holin [Candidatus Nitrosocosmicus sp.]